MTFQSIAGQPWYFTFFLKQRHDGLWYIKSGTGSQQEEEPTAVDGPSVHLHVGESSLQEFLVGGQVFDSGFDIQKVRLLSPNGLVLEDTVQNGLVLFWTHQRLILPLQAELVNAAGRVVSRQFQDSTGQDWYFTYFLSQYGDGTWNATASAGSRGQKHEQVEPQGIGNLPWLDARIFLVGSTFCVGGEVVDAGFDVVRVRLVSPDGLVLEDTVEDGLVLFQSDQGLPPVLYAELSNRLDVLVSRHPLRVPFKELKE